MQAEALKARGGEFVLLLVLVIVLPAEQEHEQEHDYEHDHRHRASIFSPLFRRRPTGKFVVPPLLP
jgi:hypothetical protein